MTLALQLAAAPVANSGIANKTTVRVRPGDVTGGYQVSGLVRVGMTYAERPGP